MPKLGEKQVFLLAFLFYFCIRQKDIMQLD